MMGRVFKGFLFGGWVAIVGVSSALSSEPSPTPTASPASVSPSFSARETSVFQLDSKWTRQDGASVSLSSLAGHPTVLAMVYLSCSAACPLTVADLKKIEGALPEAVRNEVRFALFSFDPKRDTPEKLRDFLSSKSVDRKRWSAYQGTKVTVRKLAAVLGVQYKQSESGVFEHSNVITVIDRDGRIRHQQIGLKRDPRETVAILEEIVGTRR